MAADQHDLFWMRCPGNGDLHVGGRRNRRAPFIALDGKVIFKDGWAEPSKLLQHLLCPGVGKAVMPWLARPLAGVARRVCGGDLDQFAVDIIAVHRKRGRESGNRVAERRAAWACGDWRR